MRAFSIGSVIALVAVAALMYASNYNFERLQATWSCIRLGVDGFRPVAETGQNRFLGKVKDFTAMCRGGNSAVAYRDTPWNDWANYWGAGGETSRFSTRLERLSRHLGPNDRGIDGALIDLEYQRLELITLNLRDPNTYEDYVKGRDGMDGGAIRVWKEMRIEPGQPHYKDVGGDAKQACTGELIRHRTLTGICNDVFNPRIGSTGMLFARNSQFDETFPDLGRSELHQARHADRVGLLKPDPQVISRKLLTRAQQSPERCNHGRGLPGNPVDAHCDYEAASWFNVLAAFWIQFMTHDWFSHLDEGANASEYMSLGCEMNDADSQTLGCRPGDKVQRGLYAERGNPQKFRHNGREYERRPYSTSRNHVTAWWDASQIYGYDERSRKRVKRDPDDRAKLLLRPLGNRPGDGEKQGYLPLLTSCEGASAGGCQPDPMNPLWRGQEATAFPDNWTIGLSFYHNVFAREHNAFVAEFRRRAAKQPDADSGLRNPSNPSRVIAYRDVSDDELFEAARLLTAAEIAKIHTIEWTTQLLYNEPLFRGMNANWGGLLEGKQRVEAALQTALRAFARSGDAHKSNQLYSVFAAGPGIVGLQNTRPEGGFLARMFGRQRDAWSLADLEHVNGGVNHFGSPFNFPEEFVTVYRLHPLVPDLLEYREWSKDPNAITAKLAVGSMFRREASETMHERGLANIALSMGRQRLGALTLGNHPVFLQNVSMPHLESATKSVDIPALDLIRDRERGIPRFNEFRRQYGLQSLRSFDDFVDTRASREAQEKQLAHVAKLREVYGRHECDDRKIISNTQLLNGRPMTDCLGFQHGTIVDNIEDVDTVVGWLSEFTRPHGFAISETQFVVFILNASRRLFSDRFFTSSLRREFYTSLGIEWLENNGPDGKVWEKGMPNGHKMEVSPLKRVLLRTMPELGGELEHVVNAFDPWARDRGNYYSLEWRPRRGAESDVSFQTTP